MISMSAFATVACDDALRRALRLYARHTCRLELTLASMWKVMTAERANAWPLGRRIMLTAHALRQLLIPVGCHTPSKPVRC
jgi:hypothetical protein